MIIQGVLRVVVLEERRAPRLAAPVLGPAEVHRESSCFCYRASSRERVLKWQSSYKHQGSQPGTKGRQSGEVSQRRARSGQWRDRKPDSRPDELREQSRNVPGGIRVGFGMAIWLLNRHLKTYLILQRSPAGKGTAKGDPIMRSLKRLAPLLGHF